MMHSGERPSNYFSNTFTHNQAEQIKKRVFFVQILLENTPDLNTAQSISGLNSFITHCLGHSKLLYVLHRYAYLHILVFNKCIQCMCK